MWCQRGYVRKVEEELYEFGRALQHDERRKHNSLSNTGLCSESRSNEDMMFVIYQLYLDEPSLTRSPELNPIEQVWKILVNKLQRVPLGVMRSAGSHACAHAAIEILSTIAHEEVEGCYRYCNYL